MARYDQCDDTCTTDCGHCKGAGHPFNAADPMTWDILPSGYEWRLVDEEGGEEHLFNINSGRNLTQDYWDSWN